MDAIDAVIRDFLENERGGAPALPQALTAEELRSFVLEELDEAGYQKVLGKVLGSPENQALVTKAREIVAAMDPGISETVPKRALEKAKALVGGKAVSCPHCGKPITPFKRPLKTQQGVNLTWLAAALLCFALSFIFHRYFIQCVAAALVLAAKWIANSRATRTQILIYKALSDEPVSRHSGHLHQPSSRL